MTTYFDPEFADLVGGNYPTRLTLTLKDGSTQAELVTYASGTKQNTMSQAQMEEKFLDCAAQAVAPDGKLVDDFFIRQAERMIHVLNAPSPAATASIAIGQSIAEMAVKELS